MYVVDVIYVIDCFESVYTWCECGIVIVVVNFFFFKQKTAYEMRISDWSSDVCSSDLQYIQANVSGFEALKAKVENFAPEAMAEVCGIEASVQIGRASCRERVCQYV